MRLALVGFVVALAPVFAFVIDWRLGHAITGAYGALALRVWRVARVVAIARCYETCRLPYHPSSSGLALG
jgi:hypothetical protein